MDWIDTHAHLNDDRFADRIPEVLASAAGAGVRRILVVGIDLATSKRAAALANEFSALFSVVGIQPNSLGEMEPQDFATVERLALEPRVVAIGETGMDRYWDRAPIPLQRDYFLRH